MFFFLSGLCSHPYVVNNNLVKHLITINLFVKKEAKKPETYLPSPCLLSIGHLLHKLRKFCLAMFSNVFIKSFSLFICFILLYLLLDYYLLLNFTHLHLSIPPLFFFCTYFCTTFLITLSNFSLFIFFGEPIFVSEVLRECSVISYHSYCTSFLELY